MPFVSQEALDTMKTRVARERSKASGKGRSLRMKGVMTAVGEAAGGAAAVGFIRGRLEAQNKSFKVFDVDGELVIGAALLALPFLKMKLPLPFGIGKGDLMNVGIGVLAHYTGQVARKAGTGGTETMSWSAGALSRGNQRFTLPREEEFPFYGTVSGNEGLYRATSFG